jgi:putative ATP-dependent endonuclease of OLD family
MRLSRFEIKNFKNLEDIEFNWQDIVILIGENNTGKSSVLQALDWFLSGRQIKDKSLFRNELSDEPHAIELIAQFSNLTDDDRRAVAIRGRIYNDEWILKKKFWIEVDDEGEKWKECYFSYHEVEEFHNGPENQRSWDNWPVDYSDSIEQVKQEMGNARVNAQATELLKTKVRQNAPDFIERRLGWIPNPGGGGNWKSNANSVIPEFIFVQAVHEATTETQAKDATTYGKIINLLFERRLSQRREFIDLNEQIDRVKALFTPNPEHPEWEQAQEIAELENTISEKLSEIINARAKIDTTELNIPSVILPTTVLKIDDGFLTAVTDQGHGLQRTLIITLLQVLNQYSRQARESGDTAGAVRPVVFGVEEPEIYLHPQMIRKIKDVLMELSRDPEYQIICPTHSPVLIDMAESHRSVVRFERDTARNVTVFQADTEIFSGPTANEQRRQLKMIAEFDSSVNEIFFSKRVVLVEGDTEMAVFQESADLLDLFPNRLDRRDTTFINCRGKGSILLFMKVLNHFRIGYLVVHDIDRADDNTNQQIMDEATCNVEIITFNPNIETVLGYSPSGKDKPIRALRRLHDLHSQNALPREFCEKVRQIYGVQ